VLIGEFLHNRFGLETNSHDLQALNRVGGEMVGNTTFYADLDKCVAHIEPWMPIYFFPIGVESGFHIGIHLRPSDIASGRIAIIKAVDEAEMIEVAGSLRHYIFLCLAGQEGYVNETGPLSYFDQSVSVVNRIFGKDFYQPGRYGKFMEDDADQLAINVFGGTPYYYYRAALFEDDVQKKLDILAQGIVVEPDCMALYAAVAELHYELDDKRRAAETLVRSLKCFHHTSYSTDLDEYYEMGRSLIQAMPDAFSEEARRDLATVGEEARLNLVMALYQDEEVVEATKMLCDLCHSFRDYNAPLEILRKHYSKLGWNWALALCDLRNATWSPGSS
jgi:tetratricopeptide (TPR) repeat protein